nr:hypothetical protein [Deinococcus radiopugnans]
MAQEGDAGFEVVGQFGTLEIGGFWSRHTPKTPPFILPIRNLSHVQGFPVQHSLNSKMSGTEVATKIHQAADLARQTQLQLSDVCPDGQIGKYHVTCQASGYDTDIRVTADKRTWSKKVEISGANANALSDQYVLVSGGVSGALSYIESQVFNLSSGQLVMENDGGLIYRDENFAVFSATESKIGISQYNPIIYIFNMKTGVTRTVEYTIDPRQGCGEQEDMTYLQNSIVVYVRDETLIFPRRDTCGIFEFTAPLE